MREMQLFELRIDDTSPQQILILREKDGTRILPIVIGIFEAHAIQNRIANSFFPRPLTHDLLANILQAAGVVVEKIVVTKLEKTLVDDEEHGTFFARIHLVLPGGEKQDVDARPSDAIALAVRVECPIFAEEEVLDQTGVP